MSVNVLPDASVVSPLSDTAPVDVENVPVDPDALKLPDVCVYPVMFVRAPALVSLPVPLVNKSPSDRLRFATFEPFELRRVRVEVEP